MNKWHIIGLIITGIVLLIGSLLLRVFSDGKYEIKTTDLVLIIIPLLVVGLATGKLRGLDLFGVKADLSQLWADAADTQIEQQISTLPISNVQDAVQMIESAPKRSVHEIPQLIQQKTQALEFQLGKGGYYGPAIKKYFEDLSGSSYLRYVVINRADNSLFGIYIAADLIAYLRTLGQDGYAHFEHMLNQGDNSAQQQLTELPGFIPSQLAVTANIAKRDALLAMEKAKLDTLPVKDAAGRFIGTIERAKLTTSLILDVTERLAGVGQKQE